MPRGLAAAGRPKKLAAAIRLEPKEHTAAIEGYADVRAPTSNSLGATQPIEPSALPERARRPRLKPTLGKRGERRWRNKHSTGQVTRPANM